MPCEPPRPNQTVSMKTEAGPSELAMLPSSTWTSKVSLSPSSLGDFRTATISATPEPSFWNTETVALGGSLAKLPVVQMSTMSGVSMWPTPREGRVVKITALGDTPSRVSFWPARLAPRAFTTIREEEYLRIDGTPIVFWAGAVTALGAAAGAATGAGAWARASPGARNAAAKSPKSRWVFILTDPSFPGAFRQ